MANEALHYAGNSDILKNLVQVSLIVKHIVITQADSVSKAEHDTKSMEVLYQIIKSSKTAFTRSQLVQLRDKHAYLKLYNDKDYSEVIDRFIEKFSAYSRENLPKIIPLNMSGTKKYILKEYFYQLFYDKLESLGYKFNKELNEKLQDRSSKFYQDPISTQEESYNLYFDERFRKDGDFLPDIFKNPQLLSDLIIKNPDISTSAVLKRERFFSTSNSLNLLPVARILNGNFENFSREARLLSPYQRGFSIIDFFLDIFKIFGRNMGKAINSQIDERKKLAAAQKAVPAAKMKKKAVKKAASAMSEKSAQELKSKAILKTLMDYEKELCEGMGILKLLPILKANGTTCSTGKPEMNM